jgi:hypothetical protein
MQIFRPIVRLRLRTIHTWLWDHVRDIYYGFRNIIRWTPVIWFDEDSDWSNLADVMEFKLRLMEKEFRERGHNVNSDRDAKQCRICADLLKRLNADDYWKHAVKRFGKTTLAAKHAHQHSKSDKAYLGLMIGKYLNHWWD